MGRTRSFAGSFQFCTSLSELDVEVFWTRNRFGLFLANPQGSENAAKSGLVSHGHCEFGEHEDEFRGKRATASTSGMSKHGMATAFGGIGFSH